MFGFSLRENEQNLIDEKASCHHHREVQDSYQKIDPLYFSRRRHQKSAQDEDEVIVVISGQSCIYVYMILDSTLQKYWSFCEVSL